MSTLTVLAFGIVLTLPNTDINEPIIFILRALVVTDEVGVIAEETKTIPVVVAEALADPES
jgi:hypothetical protein